MEIKPDIFNHPRQKRTRQTLRRNMTKDEKKLWFYIKRDQFGVRFRRQYGIGRFIVDFYCPEKKLAIELDGLTHDSPKVQFRDTMKNEFLVGQGITVLRYTSQQLYEEKDAVLQDIRNHVMRVTPP